MYVRGEDPGPSHHQMTPADEQEEEQRRRRVVGKAMPDEAREACSGAAPVAASSSEGAEPHRAGPEGSRHAPSQVLFNGGPPQDMLDTLYRTVEATITVVTKLSGTTTLPSSS